jgi:hypothetical protein
MNINTLMKNNQHGGFLPLSIIPMIGKAFAGVAILIGNILFFVIYYGMPYIKRFLLFSVVSGIILSLFGFLGVFVSFFGLFVMYYKLFKKAQRSMNGESLNEI